MRQRMQEVMRYAGPRMLWHHPVTAIGHLWPRVGVRSSLADSYSNAKDDKLIHFFNNTETDS